MISWPQRLAALALTAAFLAACGPSSKEISAALELVPQPDLSEMESQVREILQARRAAILEDPLSADAWGRFGMTAHAHELWAEADIAYRQAATLNPDDESWPYYLGDVLATVGTDLPAAAEAFRRALTLRPDYAPAHMRLGNVLVADNRSDEAEPEFERALELKPDLQQARVPLAQIRLGQGSLEAAAELLEEVLRDSPKHGQALSTLAQVYMRQGNRDEARAIADRAREPANYNLFADPLMSRVVAEGVSSVQLWERAKSFLESGNSKQAVLGLRQVVEITPENADAQQQLGVAYGNLGKLDLSRNHLEKAVELDGDSTNVRIQLALLLLETGQPADSVPHLKKVLELAPQDPDAGWLLGKALVATGAGRAAIETFEQAAMASSELTGSSAPAWAHNEWGRALAENGRVDEGTAHFQSALEAEPDNPQALFYYGLVLEGQGKTGAAIDHYCRSKSPPAFARVQELGRTCS